MRGGGGIGEKTIRGGKGGAQGLREGGKQRSHRLFDILVKYICRIIFVVCVYNYVTIWWCFLLTRTDFWPYLHCIDIVGDPDLSTAETCAGDLKYNWTAISQCYKGDLGYKLVILQYFYC